MMTEDEMEDYLDKCDTYLESLFADKEFDSPEQAISLLKHALEHFGIEVPDDLDKIDGGEMTYKVEKDDVCLYFCVEIWDNENNKYSVYASFLTDDEYGFVNGSWGEVEDESTYSNLKEMLISLLEKHKW